MVNVPPSKWIVNFLNYFVYLELAKKCLFDQYSPPQPQGDNVQYDHQPLPLATARDLVSATAGRMTHRSALRRVLEAGGRRVGRRAYVSIGALQRAYGGDFAQAVRDAILRKEGGRF